MECCQFARHHGTPTSSFLGGFELVLWWRYSVSKNECAFFSLKCLQGWVYGVCYYCMMRLSSLVNLFFSRLTGMRCNDFITILKHFYCLHLLLLPWLFWTFTLDGIQLVQMCTILIQMFAGLGIWGLLLLHDALQPCEAFLGWQEWDKWAPFVS